MAETPEKTLNREQGAQPAEAQPSQPAGPQLSAVERIMLEDKVIEVLRSCYDPEIPVNIYELGLVYETKVEADGRVVIKMTLTSPMCPVAGTLPPEVANKVKAVPGVTDCRVDLTWEPPWNMSMMSEAAKLQLGLF